MLPCSECTADTISELEISAVFDTALIYYVIGRAFMDDNDAGSAQKGASFMSLYERELNVAAATSSSDSTSTPQLFTSGYRGVFDQ